MTVNLLLPAEPSLSPDIDSVLLKNGYFFCGFKPTPEGSWKIVYCNLMSQLFDFGKLQIFTEDSQLLCKYIQGEYEKTV